MKKNAFYVGLGTVLFLLLVFSGSVVNFLVNIKWYNEVGYLSVYFTKLVAVLKLMVPIFIILFIGIWLYYSALSKNIKKHYNITDENGKIKRLEKKILIAVDVLVSFGLSISIASSYWVKILQFGKGQVFNVKDPIFNLDLSFFVFKLPLIESIYNVFLSFLILLVIVTFIVYFLLNFMTGYIPGRRGNMSILKDGITKFAGRQLAVVASLIMVFVAIGYSIKALNLVYSPRGVVFGASYTDIHVSLKFYYVIIAASLIGAIITFISIMASKFKPIVYSVIAIVALGAGELIVSAFVQGIIVSPNTKTLEKPYIQNNIKYTRMAYNLSDVKETSFNINNNIQTSDLQSNKETINNIKINSYAQTLQFINQVQVMKSYYNFNDVDVDRYKINGVYNQVFIAAREMDTGSLTGNAAIWQNKHLQYTHGFGVVMTKVNSVTSTGQPDFVVKNIPPENSSDIKITNPRIYYGETTNDYAIVNNTIGEFDYPDEDKAVSNNYVGTAGIKLNFLNRVLFAIKEAQPNILLSSSITSESKILLNRNIVDRVKKIAPFLSYDKDPYMVIDDGKLYWIIDAYTTTNQYPYSQPVDNRGVNYIRNSVKVVIDAYNGTTNFYIVDENDPLAATYAKIFPSLFKPLSDVPTGIKEHFRYAEDLFDLQCQVMGKYHVTDADTFYNSQDLWEVAQSASNITEEKKSNESTYTVMKLPNEQKEEMVLVNYFNAKGRDSLSGLFGARMDSENYGKLVLYRFPTDTTVNSPHLFKNSLQQDPDISKALSLWNTNGSTVVYGDTVIVPIKSSLLYVVPIYLKSSGTNAIPEVKKIVVGYSDQIVLADSIADALNQIFKYNSGNSGNNSNNNNGNSSGNQGNGSTVDEAVLQQAKNLYDKALEAQKAGDWTSYGNYINSLGSILEQLTK